MEFIFIVGALQNQVALRQRLVLFTPIPTMALRHAVESLKM